MDRETLIARLVDHARHPRHRGRLEHPDVSMQGGNPGCGDVVTLYVRANDQGDRVAAVSFEGDGCTISMGATSLLLQRINRDQPGLDDVAAYSYDEMLDLAGREVVGTRHRCATLALGTLKAAVKALEMDRKLRAAGYSDEQIREMRQAVARQATGAGLVVGGGAEVGGAGDS